ncbi:MAG: 16S rRNA (adenine(1518)-N(6)/adenine(1519)-N(6))-dimethyltransferase RsmA [Firmicutes bacterium]|nr:16S rRNA (adenine(1518)-N(6)/adenine(1519)-N(6))-dimethyltransferase RsmA [Bacillota bacterium]
MEYSFKKMTDVLNANGFKFSKKFGQNFIVDENIINNIINKSMIDKDTLVIEIGPGAGSLTYKLALNSKNVIAYEIDESLKDILNYNLSGLSNVEIIYGDFLLRDVKKDLEKYEYKKLYVVANLPYYITTPIIVKLIEDELNVDKIVVMVQKEVGDRFKAKPNSKDYSSLSVFLNYYYDVFKIMDVSRNVFMPKPNVDSIVLEFVKKDDMLFVKDKTLFFKLIRDSFKQKRKNIRNNLKGYDLDVINDVLSKYGFDLNARAEQLSIEVFVSIANKLC